MSNGTASGPIIIPDLLMSNGQSNALQMQFRPTTSPQRVMIMSICCAAVLSNEKSYKKNKPQLLQSSPFSTTHKLSIFYHELDADSANFGKHYLLLE